MASGKQVSFSYGEISPSKQFASNEASFSQGLSKLRNAYVRAQGGVSNRVGFKYLVTLSSAVTDPGLLYQNQKSKLLSVRVDEGENRNRILGYSRILRYVNPTYAEGSSPASAGSFIMWDRNGGDTTVFTAGGTAQDLLDFPSGERSVGGNPRKAQATQVGDNVICTFGDVLASVRNYVYTIEWNGSVYGRNPFRVRFSPAGFTLSGAAHTCSGNAPTNLAVRYIFMVEFDDGKELYLADFAGAGHPHGTASGRLTYSTFTYPTNLKSVNVYRSAGTINSAFSLVGKVPINDSTISTIDFYDYVIVGDITNGPPINERLWGKQYGASPATNFKGNFALSSARRVMSFQQRLFVAYDPNENTDMPEGTIGVSRLGVPNQLHSPDIPSAIDAFEFKIPVPTGAKILHMIPMERGLIFTSSNVIMLKGSGEQGFVTATEVNPSVIFFEGASEWITPAVSGSFCFFVTPDHGKVMAIQMEGNQYKIVNISAMSDHLLKQDIVEMQVTNAKEVTLWLLRRDGKIVSVTLGEAFGFALHETDGLITSIAKFERRVEFNTEVEYISSGYTSNIFDYNKADEECLAVQVLRDINGQRNLYLESLVPRIDEDLKEEGFTFSDSFVTRGVQLSLNQNGKYCGSGSEEGWDHGIYFLQTERPRVNIQDGTDYADGDPVNLRCETNYELLGIVPHVDFYYDETVADERDGGTITIKRTIRFTRTGAGVWDGVKLLVPGYFEQQVPAELQDSTALAASNVATIQTRYCFPTKVVTVAHLAGKEVSVFADGNVISSPNSPDDEMPTLTVDGSGNLDLGAYYGYAIIGLPYTTTIESLDIETSDNRTLTDSSKLVTEIGVAFENTRGGYFATSGAKLDDSKFQAFEYRDSEAFDHPDRNYNGYAKIGVQGCYDAKGRTVIRQYDPLPISVLSIYPKGVSSGE